MLFILTAVIMYHAGASEYTVASPDGELSVTISDDRGILTYKVIYNNNIMLLPSRLGLSTDFADMTSGISITGVKRKSINTSYTVTRAKRLKTDYNANCIDLSCKGNDYYTFTLTFCVSDNDIAFRYYIPEQHDSTRTARIMDEHTFFMLPQHTRTFLTPQAPPNTGWEATKPSYEEDYQTDMPMDEQSRYNVGYTFPCLFRTEDKGWILISETGTTGDYCGCRLSDYDYTNGYKVEFPQKGENNGSGSVQPAFGLPRSTPWRTITIGNSLKPIVETMAPYNNVEQLYTPKKEYKTGHYSWSWLIWQDASCNYPNQIEFIDLASELGMEYTLIDANWDEGIGRENIARLSEYAQSKDVGLFLWYNSNGTANNPPQTPRNIMNNTVRRKKEMEWLERIGVKGIKVDFFGGDKQETMKLYEDILSDANDYGLMVIFHGCTIPRGWERMYPNYMGSEACLASENVYFQEKHSISEAFEMTVHPFCRNAIGSFDWGGVILNKYLSHDNNSRHKRYTSDTFEIATAITNQSGINCIAVTPNIMGNIPQFEKEIIRKLPTSWDETQFIDGFPGKYAVIARRNADKWYIAGINGTEKPMRLDLYLPMFSGKHVSCMIDKKLKKGQIIPDTEMKNTTIPNDGKIRMTLQGRGGFIMMQ